MNDVTKGHTVQSYDKELGEARGMLLAMGERVLAQVRDAVRALIDGDLNGARKVVENERKIDYFELDIDEAVFNLIAKRQPVAGDLRLVLALSKVVGNLERSGDKAGQIASCSIRLLESNGARRSSKILHHIRALEQIACRLLERSLNALAKADVEIALDVFEEGALVEEELDAAMRHLMTFVLDDTQLLGQVLDVVFVLRALASIGENAAAIAEQAIFVAKGKDVRYQNKEILIDALRARKGH